MINKYCQHTATKLENPIFFKFSKRKKKRWKKNRRVKRNVLNGNKIDDDFLVVSIRFLFRKKKKLFTNFNINFCFYLLFVYVFVWNKFLLSFCFQFWKEPSYEGIVRHLWFRIQWNFYNFFFFCQKFSEFCEVKKRIDENQ